MKKRILAWALLICMLATLLPVSAFAEGELAEDVPAEPVGADAPGGPEDLDEPTDPVILDENEESRDEPVGDGVPDVPHDEEDDAFVDPFLDAETDALPAADEPQEIVASGKCGDDLTWTLDDQGTLTSAAKGR